MSHQNSLCSAELYADSKMPSTVDVRFIVFENTSSQVKKESILYRYPDFQLCECEYFPGRPQQRKIPLRLARLALTNAFKN